MLKHVFTALVLFASAPALAQLPDAPAGDPANPETVIEFGDPQSLSIITEEGEVGFTVLFADTDTERARGLMFRDALPDDEGMLFDFGTVRPVSMWMRNTLIPLDLLFISEEGIVNKIIVNAQPHSLRPLPSDFPVRAVLEVRGGLTGERGIMPGDRVVHAMFPEVTDDGAENDNETVSDEEADAEDAGLAEEAEPANGDEAPESDGADGASEE